MMVQPIDPLLVEIIDSVDRGRTCQKAADHWTRRSSDYRRNIENESDYSLSEEEMHRIAELPKLLSELDKQVDLAKQGQCDSENLLGAGVVFFSRLSEMTTAREETFFVDIPVFDKLLCAGKAVLEGRAKPTAVTRRVPGVQKETEHLLELFRPHANSFPEEFRAIISEGFKTLSEAFQALQSFKAEPTEIILEQALVKLNKGGQMVARFPVAVRELQREQRRHIPVVGSLLETLEFDPSDEHLALLQNEGLPELLKLWDAKDDGWLLPPDEAETILDEASAALDHFEDSVPSFGQDPDAFWASVDRLEDAFEKIRAHSMPIQKLLDSSLGPEAALLLGLLDGGAPDYAARTAAQAMRAGDVPDFITELADGLEDYLESKDKLILLEMVEMLLEHI
jgi:hypothetical protein